MLAFGLWLVAPHGHPARTRPAAARTRRRPGRSGGAADPGQGRRGGQCRGRAPAGGAGPARRGACPAGRAGHEPAGRRAPDPGQPAGRSRAGGRGQASLIQGSHRAAQLVRGIYPRCWPTAAWARRSGHWPSTHRCAPRPTSSCPGGSTRRSIPRATSPSPRRSPTRSSTPAPAAPRSGSGMPAACYGSRLPTTAAAAARGGGLAGIERGLGTFDGILAVSSPPGGPTMIVMKIPCAMSSPRTRSS
jgi:hypothetical protein